MVEKVFRWMGSVSEKRPWLVILSIVLITAVAFAGVSRIKSEFGYKTMLPKGIESVKTLNQADKVFGGTSEEQVLVEAPSVADGKVLRKVADFGAALKQQKNLWPGFADDLTTPLDDMVYFPGGALPSGLLAASGGQGSAAATTSQPESLLAKAGSLSDEELAQQVALNLQVSEIQARKMGLSSRSQMISNDDKALLINVRLNPTMSANKQMKVVRDFEKWSRAHFAGLQGTTTYVAGAASMNADSNERTMKDMGLLFGLALLFIVFVLYLTFRRVSDVLLTLLVILVTVVWVMGLGGWLNFPFNYTSSAIIPLLLGIDIAYAIHVLSRYYEERRKGDDPHKAAVTSVVTVGIAVFLTAATTAFGFASFGISNMPPIQQFGALCVAGVLLSFVLAVTLLPSTLVLRDRRAKSQDKWVAKQAVREERNRTGIIDSVLVKLAIVSEHHRKIVFALTAVVLVGCLVLGLRLTTEADMAKMMPQDMPFAVAQNQINKYFGGQDLAYTLAEGDILDPRTLNTIAKYEDALASSGKKTEKGDTLFLRDKMLSIADIVMRANGGSIPATRAGVYAVLMGLQTGSNSESSNKLINPKYPDITMITVRIKRGTQNDMKAIADAMRAENVKLADSGVKLSSSGLPLLINDMMGSIVPTQLKTSAVALLLCALIVMLIFGSIFFGLAATSVVFIGIALEIGALSLLHWPLDFMTVMVSSLVIGAGIDFGIHVTHRFREEWHHGGVEIDEAMRRTIGNVGKALVAAAVTTAGAFAIIAISDISYLRRFGGITAWSLISALLAALLVLPSILAWRAAAVERKRDKEPTAKATGSSGA
jgi:uncharacterized protein